jgi:hypothetical protein
MNYEITESVQHAVVPGECRDLYYAGEENTEKSCFSSLLDNRYVVAVPSKSGGSSSTITFNPEQGVSDVVLSLSLPAPGAGNTPSQPNYNGLSLTQGWGYAMIKNIALRIGGSSLYYFTGQQMFLEAISDCEDSQKRNDLALLGGQACITTGDFADVNKRTAFVYLKLPFNSPSAQEKPLPLATDLLTQPLQIIIEFNSFGSVFFQNSAVASPSVLPVEFASADVCFRQTHLQDAGMLLARRENMNEKAYSYPLRYFPQTAFATTTATANTANDIQINLTGFRSGQVKDIMVWAVKQSDLNSGNPWAWALLNDVKLLVNGLVYYDARSASHQMWSLVDRKTSALVSTVGVQAQSPASGGNSQLLYNSYYIDIPFAQRTEVLAGESIVASGLPIMNSVVNLSLKLPTTDTYVIFAEYRYASSLLFSKGSCEYIF